MTAQGYTGGSVAIADVSGLQAALDLATYQTIRPLDHGTLTAWNFDPGACVQAGTVVATAGLSYIFRFRALSTVISNLHVHLTAGGVSLTANQCFMSLHNDAGAQLGPGAITGSLHATGAGGWGDGGFKTLPLNTPMLVTPYAWYKARLWFNGTTGPTLSRGTNSAAAIIDAAMTAPALRWATADAGLTTAGLAPANLGALTGSNTAWWIGAS